MSILSTAAKDSDRPRQVAWPSVTSLPEPPSNDEPLGRIEQGVTEILGVFREVVRIALKRKLRQPRVRVVAF